MSTPVFSFEFYPPKTPAGWAALGRTVSDLTNFHPSFMDVTFGAGGAEVTPYENLRTAAATLRTLRIVRKSAPGTQLFVHLPSKRFDKEGLEFFLRKANADGGIAMGGDGKHLYPETGYTKTEEFITGLSDTHQRMNTGKPLDITVVVEPQNEDAFDRLKQKIAAVPAEANAKVTRAIVQYSYDPLTTTRFLRQAQGLGIELVAGVMPIQRAIRQENLKEHFALPGVFTDEYGVIVPQNVVKRFAHIPDDDEEAIKRVGRNMTVQMLEDFKSVDRIHMFASNAGRFVRGVIQEVWPSTATFRPDGGHARGAPASMYQYQ